MIEELRQYRAIGTPEECRAAMPSCGSCNRYKSTMDLEDFRKQLQKIPDRLKRDVCTYNIALRYGMVKENREPIKFYFEKVGGVDE